MALMRLCLALGALPSLVVIAAAACARQVAPAPVATPLVIGSASAAPQAVVVEPTPPSIASAAPSEARVAGPPCPAECHSQPSRELIDGVSLRAKQSRRCFNAALAKDPTLHGKVSVQLRIASDGHVCTAEAKSMTSDPGMVPVAECVAGVFLASQLAPIGEGCADVILPIVFVARGPDAGP